jgi:hypothetical protein
MKDRRSTHAGTPTRYVPPSGFGYPLGGLLPSIPCRLFFTPAALMGFTLRSVLLSSGLRTFPAGSTHLPSCLSVLPTPWRWAGPTDPGSWGLPLRESLAVGRRVSSPDRRMLPWVLSLLGFSIASLVQDFARTPPSRFASQATGLATRYPTHRRPGVSIGLRLARSAPPQQAVTAGQGDPSRVSAPARSRAFRQRVPRAMCSPPIVSCIAAD